MFSSNYARLFSSSQLENLAEGKRTQMEFQAQGADNPFHAEHVRTFCEYVEFMVASAKSEIRELVPIMIEEALQKRKVRVEVDEASMKTVKRKIEDMLSSILNLGKR